MLDTEVLIIGAGPAGSTAAFVLASRGVNVLIVDRHEFPRHKVCGDALSPDALALLKDIGIYSDIQNVGHSLSCCRVFAPNGDSIQLQGEFITIRRILFDNILYEAALVAGAHSLSRLSFENCFQDSSKCKIQFKDSSNSAHCISAKYVILATGANPLPLKKLALLQCQKPSALAVRRYVFTSERPEKELIFSYEKILLPGYAWIFPLGKGLYNVGCGLFLDGCSKIMNLHELYHRFVTKSRIARDLLSNAQEQSPLRGAPLRTGFRGCLPGNGSILVVGEALGLTYPASGEGIGKCMKSGQLAAQAILTHRSRENNGKLTDLYCKLLKDEIKDAYKPYMIAQKWLKYSAVSNLIVNRANRSESLKKLLEDIVKEEVKPTRVISLWGLTKVFLNCYN